MVRHLQGSFLQAHAHGFPCMADAFYDLRVCDYRGGYKEWFERREEVDKSKIEGLIVEGVSKVESGVAAGTAF